MVQKESVISILKRRRTNYLSMKKISILILAFLGIAATAIGQTNEVTVENTPEGWKLMVDGEPTMVNGMNWDYFPEEPITPTAYGINLPNLFSRHSTMKWRC